ncbi:MAG: hypothetical protein IJ616_00110 [Bacteroidales bacterium]|nr:hypothetical protein [Bacteroidales bacterium]
MKTKNILKALVLASVLVSACGKNEIADDIKGYTLPVTINITRQGDDATTRATYTYDEDTKKGTLSFSTGDKLFVHGFYDEDNLYDFAGVLTWQSGDTFSGTIYIEGPFEGTAEELLSSALGADATLLPAGYGGYGFLSIDNEGTCDASLNLERTKAFALTKATAVEQFSDEFAEEYNNGFALSPERAIVCFTISGLEANKEVAVSFKCNHPWGAEYSWSIDDNVTVDATGVATFAVGMAKYENFTNYSLTVDGNAITLPADKEVEAGKIYNISRSVAPAGPTAYTLTESTVGMVVGTDGNAYAVADKDNLPDGVTAVGMVAYKDDFEPTGIVIALTDESDNTFNWTSAKSACSGKFIDGFEGYTWKVPTTNDWYSMFQSFGGNGESWTGLNTAILNAGGNALKSGDWVVSYWTEDPVSGQAKYMFFNSNGSTQTYTGDQFDSYVRACFKFGGE